jgi:hypothetical protein
MQASGVQGWQEFSARQVTLTPEAAPSLNHPHAAAGQLDEQEAPASKAESGANRDQNEKEPK